MTKKQKMYFQCDCGMEYEADRYQEIDGSNKTLKNQFLNRDLFVHTCPYCNQENYDLYPVNYRDDENKLYVYTGTDGDLAMVEENKEWKKLSGFNGSWIIAGATNSRELTNIVLATERNLDYRIVNLLLVYLLKQKKLSNKKEKEFRRICDIFLDVHKSGKLHIVFECLKYDGEYMYQTFLFDYGKYKRFSRMQEHLLEGASRFYFSMDTARMLLSLKEEEQKEYKESTIHLAVVADDFGNGNLVYVYDFQLDELEVGDDVIITYEKEHVRGEVKMLLEKTAYECYTNLDKMEDLVWIISKDTIDSMSSECLVDNTSLKEDLLEYKQSNYIESRIPHQKLHDSVVYLAQMVQEEQLEPGVLSRSKGFLSAYHEENAYLCVFLSPEDAPMELEDELHLIPFSFDDVVKIAISFAGKGNGILFNLKGDSVVMDFDAIMSYKHLSIMTNKERMKEFLLNATKREKEYIEEPSFQYISDIYLNDKVILDLTNEYGKTKDEIGEALGLGYRRIKTILQRK